MLFEGRKELINLNLDTKKVDSTKKAKKKLTLRKKALIVLGSLLCVIAIILASAYGTFLHYYNKMNIISLDEDNEIVTAIDYEEDDINEQDLTEEEKKQLEELFEDADNIGEDTEDNTGTESGKENGKETGKENGKENGEQADKETEKKTDTKNSVKTSSKDVTNILLVGTDSRLKGNRRSRTDTMVILSIDKKNKKLTMTSVLRDTYVKIPGVGSNRLNAAFVYGGPSLLFKTFEKNFDIHLDKYVQIDFFNFVRLVDTLGGVDMNISQSELKIMNNLLIPNINSVMKKNKTAHLIKVNSSGRYHLNGVQALAYSRIRYVGQGDFGRTERQRKVLTQLIKKTKKLSLSELNDLADIILPMLSTNLKQGEVMSLLLNAKEYLNYKVVSGRMPIDGSYKYLTIRGASVLGVNFDKNRKYWYNLVYGK